MVVSVRKGDRGTVYDAIGNVVEHCIIADTETGECTVIKVESDVVTFAVVDDCMQREFVRFVRRPAPLRFEMEAI